MPCIINIGGGQHGNHKYGSAVRSNSSQGGFELFVENFNYQNTTTKLLFQRILG
jgi:hypothetical protein